MDYLQSTIGFFALLSLGAIFSENIKSIKLKYVISGVVIQLVLAILLTRVDFIGSFFSVLFSKPVSKMLKKVFQF